jgi:hypothetical protein
MPGAIKVQRRIFAARQAPAPHQIDTIMIRFCWLLAAVLPAQIHSR